MADFLQCTDWWDITPSTGDSPGPLLSILLAVVILLLSLGTATERGYITAGNIPAETAVHRSIPAHARSPSLPLPLLSLAWLFAGFVWWVPCYSQPPGHPDKQILQKLPQILVTVTAVAGNAPCLYLKKLHGVSAGGQLSSALSTEDYL